VLEPCPCSGPPPHLWVMMIRLKASQIKDHSSFLHSKVTVAFSMQLSERYFRPEENLDASGSKWESRLLSRVCFSTCFEIPTLGGKVVTKVPCSM
jgi:hypothetical protein